MKKQQAILLILLVIVVIGMGSNVFLRLNPSLLKNNLLGQVGVFVGVEPNPHNTVAGQLEKKEKELTQKEEELKIREEMLQTETVNVNKQRWYLMAGVAGVLLALIGVQAYMNRKRRI